MLGTEHRSMDRLLTPECFRISANFRAHTEPVRKENDEKGDTRGKQRLNPEWPLKPW